MIITKRLVLRPLLSGDAAWITAGVSLPEVHRWLTSVPHPYALKDADAFVERIARLDGYRVIDVNGIGRGVVSVVELIQDKVPSFSLGYWLHPDAWGQGIMTEAAAAMVGWHFARTDADLGSGWIVGNDASRNVLSKLGFEPTGVVRNDYAHFHGREMPVEKVRLTIAHWATVDRAHNQA